jgi:hypothetical protein
MPQELDDILRAKPLTCRQQSGSGICLLTELGGDECLDSPEGTGASSLGGCILTDTEE